MKPKSLVVAGGLYIKEGRSRIYIAFKNLMWLEANGNYIVLHLHNQKNRITRKSLADLMSELPAAYFIRVHKSYIVHMACVTEIRANTLLIGQEKIPIGRSYKKEVEYCFSGSIS